MKKILFTTLVFSLVIPLVGSANVPRPNSSILDPEMNSELNDPAINGHSDDIWRDDQMDAQKMEENDEAQVIDYTDRTRTERERKAINTSGTASDDK